MLKNKWTHMGKDLRLAHKAEATIKHIIINTCSHTVLTHICLDTLLAITKFKYNFLKNQTKKQVIKPTISVCDYPVRGIVQPSCKHSQLWAATDWSHDISWWCAMNFWGEKDVPLPLQLPTSTCTVPGSNRMHFKLTEMVWKWKTTLFHCFSGSQWCCKNMCKRKVAEGDVFVTVAGAAPCLLQSCQRVLALHPGPPKYPPNPRSCPQNKKFHIPSSATVNSGLSWKGHNSEGSLEAKDTHRELRVKEGSRACLRAVAH